MDTTDSNVQNLALKYALVNALEHDGSANANSVLGRILSEIAELRKESARIKPIVIQQVAKVNGLQRDQQRSVLDDLFPGEFEKRTAKKKEISKAESEKEPTLPDLPGAEMGSVVTRFPPEPNGFMHIGHAKAATLGYEYAKRYNGQFIVRFDDTNPAAEKKEYYAAFLESLNWLGLTPNKIRNASDDIPFFYELAERMIRNSKAYVCTCTRQEMQNKRNASEICEHRSNAVEFNLSLWNEMLSGKAKKSDAILRFVGDMQSLNTTMRDPVLFRIVEESHPLKGREYNVWPTYDFDGAVEDSHDGVTHAMRSKEYELRDELYYALLDSLEMRKPRIIEFSRLQLANTTVSKRNLRKLIEAGYVSGWDDPRLPTISALRRRGFLPQAIREFIISMGLSKVESQPTWDLLESINRKLLDPIAKRYFFVSDPVSVNVIGEPEVRASIRLHPTENMGVREIDTHGRFQVSSADASALGPGSRFRLIDLYNVEVASKEDRELEVKKVEGSLSERIPKLQWVATDQGVPFKLIVTGPLLVNEEYNPASLKTEDGIAESAVASLPVGDIVQFVRIGFCRLDSPGTAILAHK